MLLLPAAEIDGALSHTTKTPTQVQNMQLPNSLPA
jgi:hypothetical protein